MTVMISTFCRKAGESLLNLEEYRMEAAWRLGDWETLTDMARDITSTG
jgi:hypothetical protein